MPRRTRKRGGANLNDELIKACHEGNNPEVSRIIAAGADVNKAATTALTTREGYVLAGSTPLFMASQQGHASIVEQLIAAGADVKYVGGLFKKSALHYASDSGHVEIVEMLIAAGANINEVTGYHNETPLFMASKEGHLQVVDRLITAGADVNKANDSGETPLFIASQWNHLNVVDRLITAGADVNKADNAGRTPLFITITTAFGTQKSQLTIVERLLNGGADTTIRSYGMRPIDVAKTKEIRELLSDATAVTAVTESVNFNAPNNNSGPLYNALLTDEIAEGNILGFFPNNTGKIYPSQGILVRKATNGPYTKSAAWRSVLESGKNPFTRAPLGPPTFRKVHVKAKTRRGGRRRVNARTKRGRDLQRSS